MLEKFLLDFLGNLVYRQVEGKPKKQFDQKATKRKLVLFLPKALKHWGPEGLKNLLAETLALIKKRELVSYQQVKARQEESFYPGVVVEDIFSLVEALCFSYEFLQPCLVRERKKEKIGIGVLAPAKLDRGKNLVRLFWLYQGYQVVDLGKDLPPEDLAQAVPKHQLDILAVSCMLGEAKSGLAQILEDLTAQKKKIPLLVGGLTVNPGIAYQLSQEYDWPVYYGQDINSAGLVLAKALAGTAIEKPIMKEPEKFQENQGIASLAAELGFQLYRLDLDQLVVDQYARLGCVYCSGEKKKLCPLEMGVEKQKTLAESQEFLQRFSFALLVSYPLFDDQDRELTKKVWLNQLQLEKELCRQYREVFTFKFPLTCPFCLPQDCTLPAESCRFPAYYRPLHEQYNLNMLPTLQGAFGENYPGKIYAIFLVK